MTSMVLALAAGGFIYVASADLIPELHKERDVVNLILQTVSLVVGVLVLYSVTTLLPH